MGLSKKIDDAILGIGRILSWLNGILIIVIITQVILRYVFGHGLIILEELQWHLYAVGIMIGLSYAVTKDSHIRLDVLSIRYSKKSKMVIEILGNLILLLPFVVIVIMQSYDFWYSSWRLNERSVAPLGLCCRWAVKGLIPIGFILLGLSAVSKIAQAVNFLFHSKEA